MANRAPKPPAVVAIGVSSVRSDEQDKPSNINRLPPTFRTTTPAMIGVAA